MATPKIPGVTMSYDCPSWCTRAPADHTARPDLDGRRYVCHARREHVLTAAGPREIELSRFDVAEPDGTVTVGDVEVVLDVQGDAPLTLGEASALADAIHAAAHATGPLTAR